MSLLEKRLRRCAAFFSVIGALVIPVAASAATIEGDYLEARTSDVYTGPCFANSEVSLAGREAVLAWRVREGSWDGVRLDGLSIVAVLSTEATLGDPYASSAASRAVVLIDEGTTPAERGALLSLAWTLGGGMLDGAMARYVPDLDVTFDVASGSASLHAGDVVTVRTRALCHRDHLCGNETVYYPPLVAVTAAVPAYTLVHEFHDAGGLLGRSWSSPDKRSAFLATFAR